MSKVGLTLLGLLLAVSMTTFADAQNVATGGKPEDATKITIGGEVDLITYTRDEFVNEIIENQTRRDIADGGGLNHTTDIEGDSATLLYFRLRFDAELADKVSAVVEFENRPLEGDLAAGATWGHDAHGDVFGAQVGADEFDVHLGEAYVQAAEFLWQPLTLKAGIQNLCYDLRKNGRPFFIDLRNAELAFISPLQESFLGTFYPTTALWNSGAAAAANLGNGYFRDQNREAGGWKLTYQEGAVTLDMFWMTVLETISIFGNDRMDESLFGINFDYAIDEQGSLFRAVYANIANDSWRNCVHTLGLGIDYYVLPELELYGEFYYQFGQYGTWVGTGAVNSEQEDDIEHSAWAGYLGGKYTFQDVAIKPWLDLSYTYMSGDDGDYEEDANLWTGGGLADTEPGENHDFVSYENNNATLILENSILGFDIDSNYWKLQLEGGIVFSLMNNDDSKLSILYAYAKLVEEPERVGLGYTAAGIRDADRDLNDKLGHEVDVRWSWAYSPSLTFGINLGWLWNAEFFEADDPTGTDAAWLANEGFGIGEDVNIFMGTFDVLLQY